MDNKETKPCPWCHTHKGKEVVPMEKYKVEWSVIDEDFGQRVHPTLIHYCPFCGRYLDDTK